MTGGLSAASVVVVPALAAAGGGLDNVVLPVVGAALNSLTTF